jgi:hypothetical protein
MDRTDMLGTRRIGTPGYKSHGMSQDVILILPREGSGRCNCEAAYCRSQDRQILARREMDRVCLNPVRKREVYVARYRSEGQIGTPINVSC